MEGLFDKYIVCKANGTPTDPHAVYFVLRLDADKNARQAADLYASLCQQESPELSADLLLSLKELRGNDEQDSPL